MVVHARQTRANPSVQAQAHTLPLALCPSHSHASNTHADINTYLEKVLVVVDACSLHQQLLCALLELCEVHDDLVWVLLTLLA